MKPKALTIAGSDSSGGAGIQADLKTFSALGVYGATALTAITAQNTREVRRVYELPPGLVRAQIEAVIEDLGVDAAKTGMLYSSSIIEVVAEAVERYGFPLIVDPVVKAKSGVSLLKTEALESLKRRLLPRAVLVTPNREEAEILSGMKISNLAEAEEAARRISAETGVKAVLVKGGHLEGLESVDILYFEGGLKRFRGERVESPALHGSGCSFSAAITAWMARGSPLPEAVSRAKEFIALAIRFGLKLGGGVGPVNPLAWLEIPAEKFRVLSKLSEALALLEAEGRVFARLTPEVQMNLVYSLPKPYAQTLADVAGIPGRIVKIGGRVKPSAPPAFNSSQHLARSLLKVMEYYPSIRSALNLKYDRRLVEAAEALNMEVSFYDRGKEPEEIKTVEGASIAWGVEEALQRLRQPPDLIYHLGDLGKEPMINLFGKDPVEVVKKALKLALKAGIAESEDKV